jgi:hypothetical protein
MSNQSTNLQFPFLAPAQAQKHVTVNEALLRLDALVQLSVVSATLSAQPATPADGAVYILPAGKTGAAWGAMANGALAYWRDGAWEQITPREGWRAFVVDSGLDALFRAGAWSTKQRQELLTADRTYYVRADGNDSQSGLADSAGGAWRTLQHAVDFVRGRIDFNGRTVTIQVRSGTYGPVSLVGPHRGGGALYLIGDQTTPANVLISATAAGTSAVALRGGARLVLRGVKVQSTNAHGLYAEASDLNAGDLEFGACAGSHVEAGVYGAISLYGPVYRVVGGATSHWHAGGQATINCGAFEMTLVGTPAFTAYFAGVAGGFIQCRTVTWTGTATGQRYVAHKNGVIDAHAGLNPPLPGSTAGRTATGGVIKGSVTLPVDLSADASAVDSLRLGAWDVDGAVFVPFLTLTSGNTPVCELKVNGGSEFTHDTSFGGATISAPVLTTPGPGTSNGANGWTFYNFNSGRVFEAAAQFAPVGYLQRRGNDGETLVFVNSADGAVGSIAVSATATAFNTTSDARLKRDTAPLDAGAVLDALAPVRFTWRATGTPGVGFLAQEVAPVVPEAVTRGDDTGAAPGTEGFAAWAVDYAKLVPYLVAGVQELRARMDELSRKRSP